MPALCTAGILQVALLGLLFRLNSRTKSGVAETCFSQVICLKLFQSLQSCQTAVMDDTCVDTPMQTLNPIAHGVKHAYAVRAQCSRATFSTLRRGLATWGSCDCW